MDLRFQGQQQSIDLHMLTWGKNLNLLAQTKFRFIVTHWPTKNKNEHQEPRDCLPQTIN
ncbi:hypothetical protein CANARDRAFT_27570 [[Candida] arabinofermentans NRRL YB-2248]|uniref:Uncharacterized protein n=1 Tax=[Candida] arabinofermentans NRRL YB-2248 TaxID=983967 RepID=A0A1E4T3K6_9ASCO|nr:hypothetical protein CANARDRAFT_27570 [[Candida] arabinofermentans NRRL YB-2248]